MTHSSGVYAWVRHFEDERHPPTVAVEPPVPKPVNIPLPLILESPVSMKRRKNLPAASGAGAGGMT